MARPKRIWTSPWLAGAAIVALTLAVYIPAMNAGFMWDDDLLLHENSLVKASDGLYRFWFTTEAVDYFPLTWSSLWVEWRLWRMAPTGYHVTSILLHAASAVLLWRVLVRMGIPGAWLAGVLFAVHPVNVESVAWISERKNTLAMVFCLLTALAYLRSNRGARRAWYAACLVFFALSLLSKPAAVMLPVALLVVTWWRRGRITRRDLALAAPMLAMSLVLGVVTVIFQSALVRRALIFPGGFAARLAGAGWAAWFYLYKAVLPARLSLGYRHWNVEAVSVLAFVPLALLVGCFAGLWAARRMRPPRAVLAALACFVVVLVPLLGFIDDPYWAYSPVADRHQYFALVAMVALAGAGAAKLLGPPGARRRRAGLPVVLAVVVTLAALTWRRADLFANPEMLWRQTIAVNPDSPIAHNQLGSILYAQGKFDAAGRYFTRSLELGGDSSDAHSNYAAALVAMGRIDEGIAQYRAVLAHWPGHFNAHFNIALALRESGKADEALEHLAEAIRLEPEDPPAHIEMGITLAKGGSVVEAAEHFAVALKLDSGSHRAAGLLGRALAEQGRNAEAEEHLARAVRLYPEGAVYRTGMAEVLLAQGKAAEAAAQYRDVLRREPDRAETLNDLAWLLAICPDEAVRDGPEAVRLAERACELTGRGDPVVLDTLAAAYARAGRFDEAVRTAERAIRLAEAELSPEAGEAEKTLLAEYRSRLELYRAKRPYRQANP